MKKWTKPSVISLQQKNIQSGTSYHGAEQVLNCDGSLTIPGGGAVYVIFPSMCAPAGSFVCTGIDTQNTVRYVFPSGEQSAISLVCS